MTKHMDADTQGLEDQVALARRMGAMAETLRALLAWAAAGRQEGLTRLLAQAQSALINAPPVFTLEEVERVVEDAYEKTNEDGVWCLRSWCDEVLRRLRERPGGKS